MIVRMPFYDIFNLVIAILSIPALVTLAGWLSPTVRKRRRLAQYSQILSNLPGGYERERWKVIVDNQSKDARLSMRKRFNSDDLMAWLGVITAVFILIGFLCSEEFRVIFQGIHPIWDYFPVTISGFMILFSIRTWVRRSSEKRAEILQHEKMIKGMQ